MDVTEQLTHTHTHTHAHAHAHTHTHTHTHFRGGAVTAHRGAVFQDQVTCVNSPVGVDGGKYV